MKHEAANCQARLLCQRLIGISFAELPRAQHTAQGSCSIYFRPSHFSSVNFTPCVRWATRTPQREKALHVVLNGTRVRVGMWQGLWNKAGMGNEGTLSVLHPTAVWGFQSLTTWGLASYSDQGWILKWALYLIRCLVCIWGHKDCVMLTTGRLCILQRLWQFCCVFQGEERKSVPVWQRGRLFWWTAGPNSVLLWNLSRE